MKTPFGSDNATTLVSGLSYPAGLVLDETHVYWSHVNSSGFLQKLPLNGRKIKALSRFNNGHGQLMKDSEFIYFTYGDVESPHGVVISRVPIDGGETRNIARLTSDGSNRVGTIALDDQYLYWADYSEGEIFALKKADIDK